MLPAIYKLVVLSALGVLLTSCFILPCQCLGPFAPRTITITITTMMHQRCWARAACSDCVSSLGKWIMIGCQCFYHSQNGSESDPGHRPCCYSYSGVDTWVRTIHIYSYCYSYCSWCGRPFTLEDHNGNKPLGFIVITSSWPQCSVT